MAWDSTEVGKELKRQDIAAGGGWVDAPDGGSVAHVAPRPENAANIRLIAAAPDLLEALSAIADDLDRHEPIDGQWRASPMRKAARAAIAKATASAA